MMFKLDHVNFIMYIRVTPCMAYRNMKYAPPPPIPTYRSV